ncbi:hypothetical protein VIGAN_06025500 [Vigna angularis var. angularis]|uniref:Uncharacterized protein n=1 Tax=Vigna angularis var. angularis TaxID=157739 RepID=A0A0S3S973_PHAAN|nr:hypothetical protein VIGAN_06025500 [Vigna angularis var. angularis]
MSTFVPSSYTSNMCASSFPYMWRSSSTVAVAGHTLLSFPARPRHLLLFLAVGRSTPRLLERFFAAMGRDVFFKKTDGCPSPRSSRDQTVAASQNQS